MIVYESTKQNFFQDILKNILIQKIEEEYRKKVKNYINPSEENSWKNSIQGFMQTVLMDQEIPNNCGIAIEFKIPYTSKRIDFIITGMDNEKRNVGIIIELKQWSKVKSTGKDGIVETFVGGANREENHPSYQAWSYMAFIKDYNESVQLKEIGLYPCVYAHNYKQNPPILLSDEYKDYIDKAPVFVSGDAEKLQKFIKKYVKYGDNGKTLYEIEDGNIRPSKSLQDNILKMVRENKEFILLDRQKIVYETAKKMAELSKKDGKKRCLIVKGGAGTGKTVLAINLLADLTNEGMVCQYTTKNSAPRNVFRTKLHKGMTFNSVDNMFKGSGSYIDSDLNSIDVILADEAHRLNAKSGRYQNIGENQIKEIINASKFSCFFIDETQRVTLKDIGSIKEIEKYLHEFGIKEEYQKIMELESQFRCNGSDGYLSWLDNTLEIKETANHDLDFDYDIEIFNSPIDVRNKIFEKNKQDNKSRLVAGYCWNWISGGKSDTNTHDIVIDKDNNDNPIDFEMSWNLENSQTWAIDNDSVNEIGCIHTCQGLEFNYVGVIIGNDLRYENGHIITDYTKRAKTDQSLKGIKTMMKEDPEKATKLADMIIKNTYKTLMSRGLKGCYVYCEDKNLANYLREKIHNAEDIIYTEENDEAIEQIAENEEDYDPHDNKI